MTNLIPALIPLLPRHAEEGNDASRISKQTLADRLLEHAGQPSSQAIETTLILVENLLTSLCLLDNEELQRGEWKFVSHPAQLCALSLLNTWADSRQRLFSANFWHVGVGETEKQEQKRVLQALEDRRYQEHLDDKAVPVRFIYVAWAIIKIGDTLICHQREASEHATEYGLVGGRVNAADLKTILKEASPQELLQQLQTPDSEAMYQAMTHALERELFEEADLLPQHYTAQPWRKLKPWTDCRGGAPNYAVTQYFFQLYEIKLTDQGYFVLRERMQENPPKPWKKKLIECDLNAFIADTKKFDAQAIRDDFTDSKALRQALVEMKRSYENSYEVNTTNNQNKDPEGLTFSGENDILRGTPDHKTPLLQSLTLEEKSLLLGLAGHGKGLSFDPVDNITLHDYGWMEINDTDLQSRLESLAEKFNQAKPYIQRIDQRYFRLSVSPELIFFDPDYFAWGLQEQTKTHCIFLLHRYEIKTPMGIIREYSQKEQLTQHSKKKIQTETETAKKATKDNQSYDIDSDGCDGLRRSCRRKLQSLYKGMGLRILIRTQNKQLVFACKQLEENSTILLQSQDKQIY